MSEDWDGFCAICASRDHCGDLRIHEIAGASAVHVAELEAVRLCTPCFAFVIESLKGAVQRPDDEPGDLHIPERHEETCPQPGCQVCHLPLRDQPAFGLSLVPTEEAPGPGPLLRFVERPTNYHVCGSCLDWFRDVIDQESASRWTNRRRGDDPRGGSPADVRYRVTSQGLDERDEALLRGVIHDLGYLHLGPGVARSKDEIIYFVAAGDEHQAALFTGGLAVTERVRVIIVAKSEHLADATEALRLGAADLLASPLSRQQVTGAFDRLADPFAVSGRDETTGLPSYWLRPRFGLPCFRLEVQAPAGENPLETFLVLRRFLRGYDRIGVTSDGSMPAIVYCSEEHIQGVIQRMHRLLGAGYTVEITGHAAAEQDFTSTDVTPVRPAFASSAFFGKRFGRRAG